MKCEKTLRPLFGDKHKRYIEKAVASTMSVAEGAVRAGKTVDNIAAFAACLLRGTPDRIHLATGSTSANAKLNLGDCNGLGLEYIFRGRCKWTKYRGNEALAITLGRRQYIVIFAGGSKADSFKKIRGNSYGMWIATEINLHHDNTIKEAFNRQLAAKERKIFWDLNPGAPGHFIYKDYIDRFGAQFGDRYCYEHFTIADNATISDERKREIEMQYQPGSVWYRRDILGERCAAEGLVYQTFADAPQEYIIDAAPPIVFAEIGVDFGGGTSGHAFVLVGYTLRFQEKVILEEYYEPKALNPRQLERAFVDFVRLCKSRYQVTEVCCDSAEQTLINGLRQAAAEAGLGVNIKNALKRPINDRIKCDDRLFSMKRIKIMRHCKHMIDGFSSAVWDAKHTTEDVRLDNGTSNIDILDAQEYATERHMRELMAYMPEQPPTYTRQSMLGLYT